MILRFLDHRVMLPTRTLPFKCKKRNVPGLSYDPKTHTFQQLIMNSYAAYRLRMYSKSPSQKERPNALSSECDSTSILFHDPLNSQVAMQKERYVKKPPFRYPYPSGECVDVHVSTGRKRKYEQYFVARAETWPLTGKQRRQLRRRPKQLLRERSGR